MNRPHKIRTWLAIGVVLLVGLITLYTIFEYTLVSELRESAAGAETMEGATLGRLLFKTRGCAGCHGLGGVSGAGIGPDLSTTAIVSSSIEIRDSITNPDAVISGRCPNRLCQAGLMPKYGEILSAREIDGLVEFLVQYDAGEPEKQD